MPDSRPRPPKKWIAILLALFAQPLAMMYVARWRWAAAYALLLTGLACIILWFHVPAALSLPAQCIVILVCMAQAWRWAGRNPLRRPGYSRWYGLITAVLLWSACLLGIRCFVVEPYRVPSGSMLPTLPIGAHIFVAKWGGNGHAGAFGWFPARGTALTLRRGDIIVFDSPIQPGAQMVKRLIGLPGDRVAYQNKRLSLNGEPVPTTAAGEFSHAAAAVPAHLFTESLDGTRYQILISDQWPAFIPSAVPNDFRQSPACHFDEYGLTCTVPAGHYFVLGDNRDDSADSRYWGFLPARLVIGKVVLSHR